MKPETLASITDYIDHGVPTGTFLTAVLSNDLATAVMRADPDNLASLKEIVQHLYWNSPSTAHGSPEKVKAWIKEKRMK